MRAELEERRNAETPFAPFHWEIEFPEVFERENPGFDGFVGNPPFAGKNTVAAGNVGGYPSWLKEMHEESHGNADLVAHFYRRAFNLIRDGGTFGLIATNTIAQGDTRSTGLRWICEHQGEIYRATKRVKWPGDAAVIVSVLHVTRGEYVSNKVLDGEMVDRITAFLFHHGGHADPVRLSANARNSFVGSYVLGMGFTFDDTDQKGVASPLAEMQRLIDSDPRNREVIFPYIGGEEVNTSPIHTHHRYVINFAERCEAECRRRWPDLMAIVEQRVRPERLKLGDNGDARRRKERWWLWGRYTPALFAATGGIERLLAISRVGQHASFAFLTSGMVCAETIIVFPLHTFAAFCILQSRPHEIWARFFGSSLEDRLRYTPSDCFETFPFPDGWDTDGSLEAAGRSYYEYRAALMVANDEGMTKTYNRSTTPTRPTRVSWSCANSMQPWIAPSSTPTVGPTSRPTASTCSTTRSMKPLGAARRNPSGTAGPIPPVTKSYPASSPSTPNGLRPTPAAARTTCAQDEETLAAGQTSPRGAGA